MWCRQGCSYINKGLMAVIILCAFMVISWAWVGEARADTGVVAGSVVNVRSGPGSSYQVAGNLYQNTEVEVLESSSGWYKISKGSLVGWVSESLLKVSQQDKVKVLGNPVNLRSGPGTSYTVVGQAAKGDILTVLGTSGDWYQVNSPEGNACYIAASLVEKVSGTPAASISSQKVQVSNGPINIRSGPGSDYAKIGSTNVNEAFTVLEENNGWFKVQRSDGSIGWLAGWLVSVVSGTADSSSSSAPASQPETTVSSSEAPSVYLDGKKLSFEVEPVIENSRTLVPLRAIFEAMGASVEWNDTTRTVTAIKGTTKVVLPVGSTQPTVNGQGWPLDVPAKIVQNRTLAPLRFVGEAFGGKVSWNDTTRTVTIVSGNTSSGTTESSQVNTATVSETEVNLRSGPSTAYDKVASASRGERMSVLAEKDGWYQVSRGGSTAWVAGWVVNVAWEEETSTPAETNPAQVNPNPITVRPPVLGTDQVWISTKRDAEGVWVIIESGSRIYADVDESDQHIRYNITRRKVISTTNIEEAIGTNKMAISAVNNSDGTVIDITLPADIKDYKTLSEDGGKKEMILIPNRIVRVSREVAGTTGDNIIVYTLTPCNFSSSRNGDIIEVKMESTVIGLDRTEYKYSISPVLEKMTMSQSLKDGPVTTLKIATKNMGDYSIFQTKDDNALNILLTAEKRTSQVRENVVVIDAGHGGTEPGAIGFGVMEKDINLKIALKVGSLLEKQGINVEYTRTTDKKLTPTERAEFANKLNAAAFVCIHNNSTTNSEVQGTETYYYAPIEDAELFWQKAERANLATCVQNALVKALGRPNRGVKQDKEYTVLVKTQMPSILTEVSFLSNPEENTLLTSSSYQNKAAQAIADGILKYLGK